MAKKSDQLNHDANRLAEDADQLTDDADRMADDADQLAEHAGGSAEGVDGSVDKADGSASDAPAQVGALDDVERKVSDAPTQVGAADEVERDSKSQTTGPSSVDRSADELGGPAQDGGESTAEAPRSGVGSAGSADKADGSASEAAQQVQAADEVERNTKSQTTASSYTTTNHDVIRAWVEARDGQPAEVGDTDTGDGGVLRIEFRDGDNRLDEVDWDAFFDVFEDRKLAFIYQEKTGDGEVSRFNKFVSREA